MDNESTGGKSQASTQRQGTLQMEEARQEHSYPPSQSTSTSQANEVDANSVINLASGDGSGGNPTPESNTNTGRPLFLVPLTGYVLLVMASAIAFAVAKAVLALKGQSVAPTVLDLASVVVGGFILFFIGLFERVTPPIAPWFFHDDLTVDVLYFLIRFFIWGPPCGLFVTFYLAALVNATAFCESLLAYLSLMIFVTIISVLVLVGVYVAWQDFILPRLMRGGFLERVWHAYRVRRQLHPIAHSDLLPSAVFISVMLLWMLFSPTTFLNYLWHLIFPGFTVPFLDDYYGAPRS